MDKKLNKKVISGGMIVKIDNALDALRGGVKRVVIGNAENLFGLINGTDGTEIILTEEEKNEIKKS